MISAVFHQEMLRGGRRQPAYFLRWLYAVVLLVSLAVTMIPNRQASAYAAFFSSFLTLHFTLLLLLTPAMTAGAITDEKTRGTLTLLLTAQTRPADLVLGKLLGRAYQMLMLVLVGLPLFAFYGTLGDLDRAFAPAVLAVTVILILGLAAPALLASVWCRQTRDAMLITYLILLSVVVGARFLTGTPWAALVDNLDPWHAVALDNPAEQGWRLIWFAAAWLVPGGLCVLLSAWRLRPAYLRQLDARTRVRRAWWRARRPQVHGNPVLWRERWLLGVAPLPWLRGLPGWIGITVFALGSLGGLGWLVIENGFDLHEEFQERGLAGALNALGRMTSATAVGIIAMHGMVVLLVLAILVAIRASGSICEERERSTWDSVLLTPMTTRSIVRGKFWGIVLAAFPYIATYAACTMPLAWLFGWEAGFLSIGLVVAMMLAAVWMAATGLWCSAHLASAWRSLLGTFVAGFVSYQIIGMPVSCGLALGSACCAARARCWAERGRLTSLNWSDTPRS